MSAINRDNLQRGAAASTIVVRRGMGPLSVLGVIFVLCKIFAIAPVAAWSWWVVLLPFYFGIALVLAIWALILAVVLTVFIGGVTVIAIGHFWDKWKYRKQRAELKAYGIQRKR